MKLYCLTVLSVKATWVIKGIDCLCVVIWYTVHIKANFYRFCHVSSKCRNSCASSSTVIAYEYFFTCKGGHHHLFLLLFSSLWSHFVLFVRERFPAKFYHKHSCKLRDHCSQSHIPPCMVWSLRLCSSRDASSSRNGSSSYPRITTTAVPSRTSAFLIHLEIVWLLFSTRLEQPT